MHLTACVREFSQVSRFEKKADYWVFFNIKSGQNRFFRGFVHLSSEKDAENRRTTERQTTDRSNSEFPPMIPIVDWRSNRHRLDEELLPSFADDQRSKHILVAWRKPIHISRNRFPREGCLLTRSPAPIVSRNQNSIILCWIESCWVRACCRCDIGLHLDIRKHKSNCNEFVFPFRKSI